METQNLKSVEYQKELHKAWENFINYNDDFDYSLVRPEILASWKRSRDSKVSPYDMIKDILSRDELLIKLNARRKIVEVAAPYVKKMYEVVKGSGAYILVSDFDGYLLDVYGDKEIVYQGRKLSKLVAGACRKEDIAGTNAIGLAIYLQQPIQTWGEEHYCEKHKPFACSCAPFFDENNHLLGTINITLLKSAAHKHTLGMAIATADSITREMKLRKTLEDVDTLNKQRNLIIENMTSGILMLSPEGRLTQANTNALKMLGLSYAEIINSNIFNHIFIENNFVGPNGYTFLQNEMYNIEQNIRIVSQNDTPRKFNVSIDHVKNDKGNITAVIMRINKTEVIHKLVKNIEGYHAKYTFGDIIGNSEKLNNLKMECRKIARNDSNVLIIGESGTGKELIAQAIHNSSSVSTGPFVAINCAALPNSLVESELFGYEKGAFTGASKEGRPGKFELANGGTIFLDEIGDMPLDAQATLLRVIQNKEIIRIGGNIPKPINIRIIAATNKNLEEAVNEKTFRSDLYYRLNVFSVYVPPLVERGPNDVKLLVDYFIDTYNRKRGRNITVDSEVYPILCSYEWPGNVRQLENVIERAINLADDNHITVNHLQTWVFSNKSKNTNRISAVSDNAATAAEIGAVDDTPIIMNAADSEKALIISALTQAKGNITETANILQMNKRTLYRRIDKYNIDILSYRH